jgi:hypothetical protein
LTTRTTYHSFAELGLPDGVIVGNPIFVAQDEFTRNYHVVSADDFLRLCDDSWKKDPILSVSYTGNIALIDPPTQTVAHIYDPDKTSASELRNFDALLGHEILQMMDKKKKK